MFLWIEVHPMTTVLYKVCFCGWSVDNTVMSLCTNPRLCVPWTCKKSPYRQKHGTVCLLRLAKLIHCCDGATCQCTFYESMLTSSELCCLDVLLGPERLYCYTVSQTWRLTVVVVTLCLRCSSIWICTADKPFFEYSIIKCRVDIDNLLTCRHFCLQTVFIYISVTWSGEAYVHLVHRVSFVRISFRAFV
jgi:hypothetical protein